MSFGRYSVKNIITLSNHIVMPTLNDTPCHNTKSWNPIICAIHLRPILSADPDIQRLFPSACAKAGCAIYERVKKELTVEIKELVAA